jgi:hypothetical protein
MDSVYERCVDGGDGAQDGTHMRGTSTGEVFTAEQARTAGIDDLGGRHGDRHGSRWRVPSGR